MLSYSEVRQAIVKAAVAADRDPGDVTLTAVCKQQPWAKIAEVLVAGHRQFGENRVTDAAARWSSQRRGIQLRLIGPLQSNKAGAAVSLFDVIETLDRPSLAEALAREIDRQGRGVGLYVQVNTGDEPQKSGVAPASADDFIALCRRRYGLDLLGLMCLPPAREPPGPHFALLARIAKRNGLTELSMGMSGDFATAIRFGATAVRLGSALFGAREGPPA